MKYIFIFIFYFIFTVTNCQIISLLKFGNVVYYKPTQLQIEDLRGISIAFGDKSLKNRYFDLGLITDSINIMYKNGTTDYFQQKKRKIPNENQIIPFYFYRKLKSQESIIKVLQLDGIDTQFIIAEAIIKDSEGNKTTKIIYIPIDEIEGVFLGSGKNSRIVTICGGIIGGICFTLFLF